MTRGEAKAAILEFFKNNVKIYEETVEELISWVGYRVFLNDHLIDSLEENRGLINSILDNDELTVLFDDLEISKD